MKTDELSEAKIVDRILYLRGHKVMLDSDLAEIYGVTTMRLNEQVKRNLKRFPTDFMFQLSEDEWKNLISHSAISSSLKAQKNWGGRRKIEDLEAKYDEQFSIVFQAIRELIQKKNEPLTPIGFRR